MNELELQQRGAVVAEAKTWIGTPYHPEAGIKGVGVDCAYLLKCVFVNAGVIEDFVVPHYPPDWHLHADMSKPEEQRELYMTDARKRAGEITEADVLPGDIVLYRIGRCFAHGAIITQWPWIIHACAGSKVMPDDALRLSWLNFIGERTDEEGKPRPRRFFSYWRKPA